MAVSTEILRSWRAPREVVNRLLAQPRREGRILSFLVIGCLLIFVAQGPRLMREVDAMPLTGEELSEVLRMRMTYELFGWLIVWPLVFYILSMVIHLVLRLFGGRAQAYDTRLALFWGLMASTPAALLYGLVMGIIGPGLQASLTGALWLCGFIAIASAGLFEAGWGHG